VRMTIRRDTLFGRMPGFGSSALLHVAAFFAMIFAPAAPPRDPRPIYNQEIRPYESHLIWYNLRTKLPEVRPADAANAKEPRALRRFPQQLVAGRIDLPRPPQLIRVPAPQIALPEPLALPNVLAVAPPKPVRRFTPPPDKARPPERRTLPEAPQIRPSAPRELAMDLTAPRPKPLPFIPPEARKTQPALAVLPAAPVVAEPAPTADMPRIPRGFTAPAEKKTQPPAADPALAADGAPVAMPSSAQPSMAIVGLAPVDTPEIPKPVVSHEAAFSAGPRPKPESGPSAPAAPAVVVPDLMAHGSNQDARNAVMAVLRPLTRERIVAEMATGSALSQQPPVQSVRAVKAPDPRFDGRAVYAISIQMPNVTSVSGSWMVWFAERRPRAGAPPAAIQTPVPLRKVDPKYYREAIKEHVEGTVRLFAVIRSDGQVDAIEILRGIDSRLDRSAAEALAKWEFEPAKRGGVPVDVDAIFEVPFRLTALPEK